MTPLRLLVTSAGSAPAVAVIKALRQQSRYSVEIGTVDAQERSVGKLLADRFDLVPHAADPTFVPHLMDLCVTHGVQYVFPIIDEELPVWAAARDRFAAAGVTVFANPVQCVELANDKLSTASHCLAHGIPHPRCYDSAEARALSFEAFPLFAKPRFGRGSVGAKRIENPGELNDFLRRHPDGLVQELLAGVELTVDVLVSAEGELLAAVPKERLEVKAGMATKSITRPGAEVLPLVRKVVADFGIRGAANVQLMGTGGRWSLIEVNPKFAASLPLTVAAGVNLPLHLLELARAEFAHPTPLPFTQDLLMLRRWEEHFVREGPRSSAGAV
ncbi:MAG TPA: ATP-grasp domain-containing protein [Candidatus Binatia bacterium]|jgi:carbamoyl-phosphate synthase large subunit